MFRRKKGEEYYIIPGGYKGILESPEEAAVREVLEETGLQIRLEKKLFSEKNDWGEHHYFLAEPVDGDPILGGDEAHLHSARDFYRLDWVPLAEIASLNLRMPSTKALLLDALK